MRTQHDGLLRHRHHSDRAPIAGAQRFASDIYRPGGPYVQQRGGDTGFIKILDPTMIGWVERFIDDRHLVILDFRVNLLDDRPPRAGSDAQEALWVPLHDVAELDLVDGLAEFLHDHGVIATIV